MRGFKNNYGRAGLVGLGLAAMLGLLIWPALGLGQPQLDPTQLWQTLFGGAPPATDNGDATVTMIVVHDLRLPRFLLSLAAGAALALAGTLLQDSLHNALAGPELLGVSAGAALVVALLTILHPSISFGLYPWLTLLGSLVGGGIVLNVARFSPDPTRLLLVGATVSALLNAAVMGLVSLGNPFGVTQVFAFLMGSLAGRGWDDFWLVLPWVAVGVPLSFLCARALNLLQLGDALAEGLGLQVNRIRFLIVLLSAGLVASVIAVCGPVGFVALLCPHLARRLLNSSDARQVLPIAALFGALLLGSADILARLLLFPLELPTGGFTALLGGPLLLLLFNRPIKVTK